MRNLITLLFCFFSVSIFAADQAIKMAIEQHYDDHLEDLFVWFHQNPELSFLENKTAARLAEELRALGVVVTEGVGETGLVGIIENGEGPLVMIRADMDGLPILEDSGLSYMSRARQVNLDGDEMPVMHACGHDMHVTSLVGTSKMLMDNRDKWSGTVMLVGQPAEEIINGAKAMLDDGLYERFGVPDYALGLHVSSGIPSGAISIRDGIMYSSVDSVDIQVRGIGGHGAYPQQTVDPIYVASQLVIALQGIISRQINPFSPAVITVGSFQGGNKHNIISDEVNLQLTVRTDSEDVREQVLGSIRDTAFNIGRLNGLPNDLLPIVRVGFESTPTTVNDYDAVHKLLPTWTEQLGYNPLETSERTGMGGEDFAFFTRTEHKVPGIFFSVGGTPEDIMIRIEAGEIAAPPHHSPFFFIDPKSVKAGVEAMYTAAVYFFNNP
ncbi:MAG: M20 family metallopeptidase [Pseudohongiellaceae bacterium]|uniref:Peptidase M20 n=1 Tax=OM182 bacterium MED-G28 TaxID=1986256 RepID=A0A2A5WG78_9GAMM|nr:MAG: peptidase M20 [OM182 bacterium MED-G28]